MSDDAFDEFSRNICAYYGVKYTQPVVRQRPVAVTPENAAQFQPAPKKRGCKPKVQLGGNVVAFRRPEPVSPPPGSADERARDEVCRRFSDFVDRLEALTKREAERKAAQRTKGEDPKGAA